MRKYPEKCSSVLLAADVVQEYYSSKDAALEFLSQASGAAPVFSVQNYEQSFTFYLRRPVVLVDYRDEFTRFPSTVLVSRRP